MDERTVPEWIIKGGKTVLIQKDPVKRTVASNYRQIACLPLMWNLLTVCITITILNENESEYQLMTR